MAVTEKLATTPANDAASTQGGRANTPPPPYLGRSVRFVGPHVNVDMNQSPHPKNQRGELGKPLFNWYRNTVSQDPLTRVSAPNHFADRRQFLANVINRSGKGKINPRRIPVDDPAAMTRHIKAVAHYMGADVVGVAKAHPSFLYAGSRYVQDGTAEDSYEQESPAELVRRFPYIIQMTTAWDYQKLQAHRHHIGDAAYHISQMKGVMILKAMEGYIKELGYTALRGVVTPQAAGVASGIGELGRNGLVINKNFGARIHMPDPILTDLPLVPDAPVDIGVEDFCKICRKCANTCPTNSIPFGDKVVFNGIEKYKINWLTCYKLRPYVHEYWGSCLTCAAVCPFSKPDAWWHGLAVWSLHTSPFSLRPALVRALKWIDDKFWGVTRANRVRWLSYDTGVKPGDQACTVAGCTASHEGKVQSGAVAGKVGYYAPLKENTNRFVKRD
jgi:reductive dehalogenase